jgi:plastocyanin
MVAWSGPVLRGGFVMRVPPILASALLAVFASVSLAVIASASQEIVVHLSAKGFVPVTSTVVVGDRVRFTVRDRKPHQLWKVSGPTSGDAPVDVLENKGSSTTMTFTEAGTYTYLDRLNPGRHEYRLTVRAR